MDTQSPLTQPLVNPSQKKNLFQEIISGLGGIILGILVVISILFVVNYFNILQLSNLIPFLSFLPNRQSANLQINPALKQPPAKPYNAADAQQIFNSFIRQTLQSQYHPDTVYPHEVKIKSPSASEVSVYYDTWQKNNAVMGIRAEFNQSTNLVRSLSISTTLNTNQFVAKNMDAKDAFTLLNNVFLNVPSVNTFVCEQNKINPSQPNNIKYCQSFGLKSGEKLGVGILIFSSNPSLIQLFSCKIPSDSPVINTVHSCIGF